MKTKKERKNIYIKALLELDNHRFNVNRQIGLCNYIYMIGVNYYLINETNFPEFYIFKDVSGFFHSYWLDRIEFTNQEAFNMRTTVLLFCIEMCND